MSSPSHEEHDAAPANPEIEHNTTTHDNSNNNNNNNSNNGEDFYPSEEHGEAPATAAAEGGEAAEDARVQRDRRNVVYVTRFVPGTTEENIRELLGQFGNITAVTLKGPMGDKPPMAFVDFDNMDSANRAVAELNHKPGLGAEELICDNKREKRERRPMSAASAGVCYAFQRGECNRGNACRYSHESSGPRGGDRGGDRGFNRDRERGFGGDRGFDRPREGFRAPGVCYAFQRGECNRGNACKFAHEGSGGNPNPNPNPNPSSNPLPPAGGPVGGSGEHYNDRGRDPTPVNYGDRNGYGHNSGYNRRSRSRSGGRRDSGRPPRDGSRDRFGPRGGGGGGYNNGGYGGGYHNNNGRPRSASRDRRPYGGGGGGGGGGFYPPRDNMPRDGPNNYSPREPRGYGDSPRAPYNGGYDNRGPPQGGNFSHNSPRY